MSVWRICSRTRLQRLCKRLRTSDIQFESINVGHVGFQTSESMSPANPWRPTNYPRTWPAADRKLPASRCKAAGRDHGPVERSVRRDPTRSPSRLETNGQSAVLRRNDRSAGCFVWTVRELSCPEHHFHTARMGRTGVGWVRGFLARCQSGRTPCEYTEVRKCEHDIQYKSLSTSLDSLCSK